ncbi:MAG: hypothetical protein KGR26_09485, partial [Cyanobacteria bacterium REEB65]|nr:hypothetical protein [Cyanobacteria bacterium REEB65]
TGNERIRTVVGGSLSTLAGPGSASILGDLGLAANGYLAKPAGLGLLANGALVLDDLAAHEVREIQ